MKRLSAFSVSLIMFAAPVVAAAQSVIPWGPTPLQLLTSVAQLDAQASSLQSGQPLTCAAVFSTSTVAVGRTVDLAWGSVGALDPATASTTQPMWTPQGGSVLSFNQTGTWTYYFTFYNSQNSSVNCSAKIIVTK